MAKATLIIQILFMLLFIEPVFAANNELRWLSSELSESQCQSLGQDIEGLKLREIKDVGLQSALDVLVADCKNLNPPEFVTPTANAWSLPNSRSVIYWENGKLIHIEFQDLQSFANFRRDFKNQIFEISNPVVENSRVNQTWWPELKENLTSIYQKSDFDLYLTGYSIHNPATYSEQILKKLNSSNLGGGVGISWINKAGNTELIYFLAFKDSWKQSETHVGYAWQKEISVIEYLRLGFGFTAGLVSRNDLRHGRITPILLPLVSVSSGPASIFLTYIPKYKTDGKISGDVLFAFLKVRVK